MAGLNRLQLVNALNRLAAPDFEKLLFAIKPPAGLVPGPSAPQASRVMALLEWVESPTGPGIASIPPLLDDLDTLPESPPLPDPAAPTPLELGPNPYQGLRAFEEDDQDRFFGRDRLVEDLIQRFEHLYTDPHSIRILPIYGPSGSGKSSLARAGLIPALRKRPLPGKDSPRILTLKPGNHPLEVLATALARLANPDDLSIAKIREFQDELLRSDSKQAFDGLRFITDRLLENDPKAYLILLVDQFEEIYTLCEDPQERHAFICNLRGATSDPSQRVAVILTMRSDFLSATQQHPRFNQLFADPGRLVPVMQPEELEQAIIQPAKLALAKLDRPTRDRVNLLLNKPLVQILVKDAMGQEGALPLLQFLLTQMWEEMRQGIEPIETFNRVGGIGGALANEAKKIYENLSEADQKIARSIFLRLIKVNDDKTATRRRVPLSELVTKDENTSQIKAIINQFTRPGVWILITFANEEQIEMVEVAHEALIYHWKELGQWLDERRDLLHRRYKLEQSAKEWDENQRSKDYLIQGRQLREARESIKEQHNSREVLPSEIAAKFIQSSLTKQRFSIARSVSLFMIFPLLGTLFIINSQIVDKANYILSKEECKPDAGIKIILSYLWYTRQAQEFRKANLCDENLRGLRLSGTAIVEPDLRKSNLSSISFQDTLLPSARFSDSTLFRANFSGAILINSDFSETDKDCTDLVEANFYDANLVNVKFGNACIEGANFGKADLTEADLSQLNNLQLNQLEGAIICETIMPSHLSEYANRDCSQVKVNAD